jgi:hypothetical protein
MTDDLFCQRNGHWISCRFWVSGCPDTSSCFTDFGVIFAVVAGFLPVTVLNRYRNLNHALEDELNAIEPVRDFLVYLEDCQHIENEGLPPRPRALMLFMSTTLVGHLYF